MVQLCVLLSAVTMAVTIIHWTGKYFTHQWFILCTGCPRVITHILLQCQCLYKSHVLPLLCNISQEAASSIIKCLYLMMMCALGGTRSGTSLHYFVHRYHWHCLSPL